MKIYGSGVGGYENTALVTNAGELLITGSVITTVNSTDASIYRISGTHTGIGSATLVAGDYGGSVWPIRIEGGSYIMVVGSITSLPTVTISGNIHIGSVSANVDSIYIQSGNNIHLGSAWSNIGSVVVTNPEVVGSIANQIITGSVAITTSPLPISGIVNQGTNPWVMSGTSNISGNIGIIGGSINILSNTGSIPIFGSIFTTGSIRVINDPVPISGIINQGTSPWTISGVVTVDQSSTTRQITAGSIQIYGRSGVDVYPLLVTSGTYAKLQTDTTLINIGSVQLVPGSLEIYQTTSSDLTISGVISNRVGGSIVDWPGSLAISNFTALGSSRVITNFGDLGSQRTISAGSIRLLSTPGSIGVYGVVTDTDPSVGEIGSPHLGSASMIAGDWGGSTAVIRMGLGSYVLVAGSISSLPSIVQSSTVRQISAGSVILLSNAGSIPIFGSVFTTGSINQSTDPWRVTGSISQFGVGSIRIAEQGIIPLNITGSVVNYGVGSIRISEWGTIGSILGSVAITTTVLPVSGTLVGVLGSVRLLGVSGADTYALRSTSGTSGGYLQIDITNNPVPISGTVRADILTSPLPISGIVNQGTTPWSISGIINIGLGSVRVTNSSFGSEVYMPAGSIILLSNAGSIPIFGSVFTTGSINQNTNPWIVLGSFAQTNIGSVRILTDPVPISGVVNQGTASWGVLGSVRLLGVSGADSYAIGATSGTSGGALFITGSVQQGTLPWSISGTVRADILTSPVPISGIINIGLGSVRILNASFGSEVYIPAGSVIITDIQSPTGSIEVYQTTNSDMQVQATQETNPWIVLGSMAVTNIGSVRILTDPVPISGVVNQGTNPWGIIGSVRLLGISGNETFPMMVTSGTSGGYLVVNLNVGSVNIATSLPTIGSYAGVGSIIGSVYQLTSPWVISGTATISGVISNRVAGSIVDLPIGSNFTLSSPGSIGVFAGANTVFGISGTLVGISGIVNQGTNPWVVSGIVNLGSNWGGTGSVYQVASMRTYPNFDIIRKASGSPAIDYVFAGISRGVSIENRGSAIVYFNFNAAANPVNSGTGILDPSDTINLNIEIGSVSIQSSGLTSSEVQVIALR